VGIISFWAIHYVLGHTLWYIDMCCYQSTTKNDLDNIESWTYVMRNMSQFLTKWTIINIFLYYL